MKKIFVLVILLFIQSNLVAQHDFGVSTSNWCGLNGLFLNPANIADCPYKFAMDLGSANLGFDNNMGTFNLSGGGSFNYSGASSLNTIAAYDLHMPLSFMVSIGDKHSIAFSARLRAMVEFKNFNPNLYDASSNTSYALSGNPFVAAQNFNMTAHIWEEVGVSYATVLYDNIKSELKAGVTLKYLGGAVYLSLKGNNINATFYNGSDSFTATNTDVEFASNVVAASNAVGSTGTNLFGNLFGANMGSGFGADFGIVYMYRGENYDYRWDHLGSNNKYKYKLSASVTDIGAITYPAGTNSKVSVSGSGTVTGSGLSANANNYTSFKNYALTRGFTVDTSSGATSVYLPTALILSGDFRIIKSFLINTTFLANMANVQNFGNSYFSQLTITPRVDRPNFCIGLPITYSMLANDVKVGIGLRIKNLYVGSDDCLGLAGMSAHGLNIYMGGYIAFAKRGRKLI